MSKGIRTASGVRRCVRVAVLAAVAGWAAPASAETVIEGRSAQALRCAVYVGMAGQYGYAEGLVSQDDRDLLTYWSMLVLDRWVPLDADHRLAAYRTAMGELGAAERPYATIARHADWCVAEFSPTL
jgi:hypothetical protein